MSCNIFIEFRVLTCTTLATSYDADEDGLLCYEEVKAMMADIGQIADETGYRSAEDLTREAFEHSCLSMGLQIAAWPPQA